jgi:hypothetical protein
VDPVVFIGTFFSMIMQMLGFMIPLVIGLWILVILILLTIKLSNDVQQRK